MSSAYVYRINRGRDVRKTAWIVIEAHIGFFFDISMEWTKCTFSNVVIIAKHLDDLEEVEEQSITATTKSEKKKQGQHGHDCRIGDA